MIQRHLYLPLLVFSLLSLACINLYRTDLSGEVTIGPAYHDEVLHETKDTSGFRAKSIELLEKYNETGQLECESDYAAVLIYLNRLDEAKKIYHKIESENPNLYITASNLGTIYELEGKPDSALFWIKRGIELNPASHRGSEWIHVKILEYKLSSEKDITKSILKLDFGNKEKPENVANYDLRKLDVHLTTQLRERVSLVPPPNKIVGNLFFDRGNVLALAADVQSALENYNKALEYGFSSDLMAKRILLMTELSKKAEEKELRDEIVNHYLPFGILIFLFLAVFAGIVYVIYRIIKKVSQIPRDL